VRCEPVAYEVIDAIWYHFRQGLIMDCPLCGEVLAERGFFCKACAGQVRCKTCRELLEPQAIACVECGTRIGVSSTANDAPGNTVSGDLPAHRNTLAYEETRNSRTFQASLTDTAIQGLGEVFADFFTPRVAGRPPTHSRRFVSEGPMLPAPASTPAGDNGHAETTTPTVVPSSGSDKDRILRLFHLDGDTLELKDNRLKAKSQSDFIRRLTYLFLYANELHGHSSVSYDSLRVVQQVAKVWDANTRTWLAKKVGFHMDNEKNLKLTAPGREDAIKALNEALDSEVQDEWNPDKKVPRKLGPRKKT
jgi:hypothetical protein